MALAQHPVRKLLTLVSAAAVLTLAAAAAPAGAGPVPTTAEVRSAQYQIFGPTTWAQTNSVAATGAAVDYIEHGRMFVTATPPEVTSIR